MKYRNPTLPEGINTSRNHPLREFALLSLGAMVLLGAAAMALGHFAGQLSRWLISPETEARWVEQGREQFDQDAAPAPLRRYLDGLCEKVQAVMESPGGMRVRLRYIDDDTVNAFATLGGTLILHRGLLELMPHENALVMLIAHETAHIRFRDPIVSAGNAIGIQAALSLLFSDNDAVPLQLTGQFTQLSFSRDMEERADQSALQAVSAIYGHINGTGDLFRILHAKLAASGDREPPLLFNTHPLGAERIESLNRLAERNGWRSDRPTTPLPAEFQTWFGRRKENPASTTD